MHKYRYLLEYFSDSFIFLITANAAMKNYKGNYLDFYFPKVSSGNIFEQNLRTFLDCFHGVPKIFYRGVYVLQIFAEMISGGCGCIVANCDCVPLSSGNWRRGDRPFSRVRETEGC